MFKFYDIYTWILLILFIFLIIWGSYNEEFLIMIIYTGLILIIQKNIKNIGATKLDSEFFKWIISYEIIYYLKSKILIKSVKLGENLINISNIKKIKNTVKNKIKLNMETIEKKQINIKNIINVYLINLFLTNK